MKNQKEILEQIFTLAEDLKSIESLLYCDTLVCSHNVKYEYICFYKSFFDKYSLVGIKTLFALFSEQNISEIHLIETQQLVARLNLYLKDKTKEHTQYNSACHGKEIMSTLLKTKYLDSIEEVYKAIRRIKENDFRDTCSQEYEYVYMQQKKSEAFEKENEWLFQFNPYKNFNEIFDFLINFIDNYTNNELVYFDLVNSAIIYQECNGVLFKKSRGIDFYKFINLLGNKEIHIKSKMKDKVSYLIHILSDYLISDELENKEKWETEILKRLEISESTYRRKYKKMPNVELSLEEAIRVILGKDVQIECHKLSVPPKTSFLSKIFRNNTDK